MVLSSHIINYSTAANEDGLILHTKVTFGYEIPWRKVQELLKLAAQRTDLVSKEKDCFILQTALDDFYVTYELNAYTFHPRQMAQIYSDLNKHILDVFHENGIEVMSPHFTAIRDGSAIAVPVDQTK